jgi:uncharacterized membrane protein
MSWFVPLGVGIPQFGNHCCRVTGVISITLPLLYLLSIVDIFVAKLEARRKV